MSETRTKIWGEKAEATEKALRNLDADLAKLVIDVAYDDVFSRPGLDLKTRELLAIAHLITIGSQGELKTHIYGALNNGATLTEIKETLLHSAMFIGFPKVLAAMKVFKEIADKVDGNTSLNT
ncbi:MAG: carboxymuconolactone decarboxylase family protein [Trueperaceae bacterium]|nr:carboxymuconolactone decarboxylase family protein [Trueperaceae bacterium]